MNPPKVRMRTPSPTFYAFLVKFAERLASKPGNDQSKTHSCITCPLQKLVDPPVDPKDEITSGTTGIEAKMDPTTRFVTHHSRRCWFGWEKETWRRQTTGDSWIFSCFWWEMAPSSPPSNSEQGRLGLLVHLSNWWKDGMCHGDSVPFTFSTNSAKNCRKSDGSTN